MPKNNLAEKLQEQAGFLRNSLSQFYRGNISEAARIAVALRVLIHQTNRSESLLKQLLPAYLDLQIRGKVMPQAESGFVIASCASIRISSTGDIGPFCDFSSPLYELMTLQKWWDAVCLSLPDYDGVTNHYSRRYLVLTMADKEGAHVDPNLPQEYVWVRDNFPMLVKAGANPPSLLNHIRYIVGESGSEMLECLQRTFPSLEED